MGCSDFFCISKVRERLFFYILGAKLMSSRYCGRRAGAGQAVALAARIRLPAARGINWYIAK